MLLLRSWDVKHKAQRPEAAPQTLNLAHWMTLENVKRGINFGLFTEFLQFLKFYSFRGKDIPH